MNAKAAQSPLDRWLIRPVFCLLVYAGVYLLSLTLMGSGEWFFFVPAGTPPNPNLVMFFFFSFYWGYWFATLSVVLIPILAIALHRNPTFSYGAAAFLGTFVALGVFLLAPLDLDQTGRFGLTTALGTGVFLLGFLLWFFRKRRMHDRSNQRLERTGVPPGAQP